MWSPEPAGELADLVATLTHALTNADTSRLTTHNLPGVNIPDLSRPFAAPKGPPGYFRPCSRNLPFFMASLIAAAGTPAGLTSASTPGPASAPQQFVWGSSERRRRRGSWLRFPARRR